MKKIAAALCTICFFAITAFAGETMTGWVTDQKCGARVANAKGAACAKKCAEAGEPVVFVDDKDKSVIKVADQDKLKSLAGQHVKVTGSVDNGALHVESAEAAAEAPSK